MKRECNPADAQGKKGIIGHNHHLSAVFPQFTGFNVVRLQKL
jgi:hypothetical protein